jgi:hypothetical protein
MIRARISDEEITGLADELGDELFPLMEAGVEAGAGILLGRVQTLLSRRVAEEESVEPGQPPAMRSGELHDSFVVKAPRSRSKRSIERRVQVDHPNAQERGRIARKAAALEFGGTDTQGRVHPPFPFMRRAEEETRDEVDDAMFRELDR